MSSVLQRHKPAQCGWHPRALAVAEGTQAHQGESCISLGVCRATKGREVAVDELISELQYGHCEPPERLSHNPTGSHVGATTSEASGGQVQQLHCRHVDPTYSRFGRHDAAPPGGPPRLQLCMCLSFRHSRSGGHTAAEPGGPLRLQGYTSMDPIRSRSGEHTAALPDGPLSLQPRTYFCSRHSCGAAPISVWPSGRVLQRLHRCPHPWRSPAPVPTGALQGGLLLPLLRTMGELPGGLLLPPLGMHLEPSRAGAATAALSGGLSWLPSS